MEILLVTSIFCLAGWGDYFECIRIIFHFPSLFFQFIIFYVCSEFVKDSYVLCSYLCHLTGAVRIQLVARMLRDHSGASHLPYNVWRPLGGR